MYVIGVINIKLSVGRLNSAREIVHYEDMKFPNIFPLAFTTVRSFHIVFMYILYLYLNL